jgi:hypothetical protein
MSQRSIAVRTEHKEVKAKHKQLNAHIQSLPKLANWAKEHKRSAMEHKKDLTEHVELPKVWGKDANEIIEEAKAQKDVGSKACNEMQKDQKCEKGSCLNRKETIHCENGMKHEPHHGGQFNGVSCRQQMSTATQLCLDWLELAFHSWSRKQTNISEAEIYKQFGKCENVLSKLNVTHSTRINPTTVRPMTQRRCWEITLIPRVTQRRHWEITLRIE